MKENVREREQVSQKKPSARSDFIEAYDAGDDLDEMGTFGVGMVMTHEAQEVQLPLRHFWVGSGMQGFEG